MYLRLCYGITTTTHNTPITVGAKKGAVKNQVKKRNKQNILNKDNGIEIIIIKNIVTLFEDERIFFGSRSESNLKDI